MQVFCRKLLDQLTQLARRSPRLRQHRNIHQSHEDPCQRFFNAIEPGSYIRPHRHATAPRPEMLVALRGSMALITFDDEGTVTNIIRLGVESTGTNIAIAAEVSPLVWHTVIALESGSVLLEVKEGPFDPRQPKDLASWAPAESSIDARDYLANLVQRTGA